MLEVTPKEDSVGTCPLCRDAVAEAGARCEGCGASYHSDCLLEFGGTCVTLGCRALLPGYEAPPLDLPLPPPSAVRGPAPGGEEAEEEAPAPEPPRRATPWSLPPPWLWVSTGLLWVLPTAAYRLATSQVFFDLSFWTGVILMALPIWLGVLFVLPMLIRLPRRW